MAKDPGKELLDKTKAMNEVRAKALKAMSKDLDRLYSNFLARALRAIGSGPDANIDILHISTILDDLNKQLLEAGFQDVQRKYGDHIAGLTESAIDYFSVFGAEGRNLAGLSAKTLDAYIRFKEREIGNFVRSDLIPRVEKLLMDGVFGGLDRSQIYTAVDAMGSSLTTTQVEVMVDDTFAGYQRTVQAEMADQLEMTVFKYIGPNDDIISEQCEVMLGVNRHGVNGILYKDEITTDLHPKLKRDPLIGGGHPRCRHHWSPMTEQYAAIQFGFIPRSANG